MTVYKRPMGDVASSSWLEVVLLLILKLVILLVLLEVVVPVLVEVAIAVALSLPNRLHIFRILINQKQMNNRISPVFRVRTI